MAIKFNSLGTPQILAIRLLLLASAYFITGKLGLLLPFFGTSITLIWLPTGIAVAALLRWGNIYWPAILAGAFATNLAIGSPPLLAACIALGNTLGPLLAVYLLRKLALHSEFNHARDILLLGVSAAIGMTVSAGGGVASLMLFNMLPAADVVPAWLSWWAGDFTGVLLAAPLLLNISRAGLAKLREQRMEFLVWCLVTIAMGWEVFLTNNDANGYSLPLAFVMLPLAVWSAMRFGVMGSSLGLLLPVVIAAWATSLGLGPFYTPGVREGLFLLWLFLATLVLIGLMVVALQAGRQRAEAKLRVALQHEAEALSELRVMLETSGEGLWKVDQSGRIVETNNAYCHIIGYAKDEIIGAHVSKFEAAEQTPEAVAAHIRRVVEMGYDRFETKHRHRDGHLVDIEVSTSFIPEMNCFIAFLHDITERKLADVELQHNRDLLNEAQRLGQLGSWELNLVSGELRWTDEVYRIFELDPAQLSPSYENFLNAIHPDDRDRVNQAYTQSLEDRQPYDIEHRLLFADGRQVGA